KANHQYYKPEIRFGPSGAVYTAYREKNKQSGNSDIYLCIYNGKELKHENVSELAGKWERHKAYESDIEIDPDENVHVAWIAHDRNITTVQYVMYRFRDSSGWSQVYQLAEFHMDDGDVCEDTRLGVDSKGNAHVVIFKKDGRNTWYVGKYGDIILPLEKLGPGSAWVKHPDIAVTDDYVHVIWQQKIGWPYAIMYQKWENSPGAVKGEIRQITFPEEPYANQKSRIDIDNSGFAHFAIYYKTGDHKKLNYWKEQPDGSIQKIRNLSDPTRLRLYHFAGLEVRDNSIIATMQLGDDLGGQGIFYNWKKDSVWSEYLRIPSTEGAAHQSTDLSMDGETAAVVFARRDTEIVLVSSAPISATGLLETEFSHPGRVFWGSGVTFDASACAGLNPDYNIVQYDWDFGDGSVETTSNPTITHSFNSYGGILEVTLTITAETGETGVLTKEIGIEALYGGIITAINAKRIRSLFYNRPANEISWDANPKNAEAGYPVISRYEIWRAPAGTSNYVMVG
ncbi:MAG: PKD domain-containing protein, partial [bacterium]|nr:PKD domain-containing protein [bacterium]